MGRQEGCSNAIMEYMACGLPVICSEGGGNREVVEDGKTGFVIAPADPRALAQRIAYLGNHEAERRAMGAAGRRRIMETFSLEQMVDDYVRIYEEALSGWTPSEPVATFPSATAMMRGAEEQGGGVLVGRRRALTEGPRRAHLDARSVSEHSGTSP